MVETSLCCVTPPSCNCNPIGACPSALDPEAKALLSSKGLTTAEIAYQSGFEHPQSFNKLFRQKTNLSPLECGKVFNEN